LQTGEAVVVADEDVRARTAMARVLSRAGFRVLETSNGDEALTLARSMMPAAVILEVPLDGLSGYEVCHTLKAELGSEVPVVFVSGVRTESYDRVAGLLLGADDYVVKPYTPGEVLARLMNVLRRARGRGLGADRRLTKREREVLGLMGDGMRQDEIARRLFISPKTVSTHVEHILRKLGAHSSTEAVSIAFREQILQS
jgi:DNA-binding NarL/FixJ family response regulator